MKVRYETGFRASNEEMNQLISDSLMDLQDIGISELHRRLKKYNIETSSELYKSVKAEIIKQAGAVEQEIRLSFKLYGRYQDMKWLSYVAPDQPRNKGKKYNPTSVEEGLAEAPDIVRGMYEWLKTIKFRIEGQVYRDGRATYGRFNKYVGGFGGMRKMPTRSMMMYRMAWTLGISRMKKNRVKSRRPNWYNEAKGAMTHKGTTLLAGRVRELVMNLAKSELDKVEFRI